jgi:hypothetical protein
MKAVHITAVRAELFSRRIDVREHKLKILEACLNALVGHPVVTELRSNVRLDNLAARFADRGERKVATERLWHGTLQEML